MRLFAAGLVSAVLAAGTVTVTSASQGCGFQVSPSRVELDTASRSGTISVETQAGCAWTVDSDATWLHVSTSGGSGSGSIGFTADAAGSALTPRQGHLRVRWNTPTVGQNVIVTQSTGACNALFDPRPGLLSARTIGWKGGSRSLLTFSDPPFVGPWRFVSAPDWITFTSPPLGVVSDGGVEAVFVVAPNPSPSPRDGTITFCSGATMSVHQSGRSAGSGPAVPADFDGDGRADLAVYRPSTGAWWVLGSQSGYTQPSVMSWGRAGALPMPGDFDSDNRTDLVFYDPADSFDSPFPVGSWHIRHSSNGFSAATTTSVRFPTGTDYSPENVPLLADFNGDGVPDLVTYRDGLGEWSIRVTNALVPSRLPEQSESNGGWQWGLPGDIPVPADYDGDGLSELAVWRPSNGLWFLRLSTLDYQKDSPAIYQWGLPGDRPIVGDFDGDRRADLAVWRPSNGNWYIVYSSAGYNPAAMTQIQWGLPGDVPLSGDYDGDGRTDLAVWRPSNGTWYVLLSSTGFAYSSALIVQWGLPGDVPLSARITGAQ